MNLELFHSLANVSTEEEWSKEIFSLAAKLGFEQTLFALLKTKNEPLENAYIVSNYSKAWRETYDQQNLGYVDPTVAHTLNHSVPLLWTPEPFKKKNEKEFFEEASSYGLKTGIILPIHGFNGEFGMFSFSSERLANIKSQTEIENVLPDLALLRDYVFETSLRFLKKTPAKVAFHLTPRELEILKWMKISKSSWEIGKILSCSEATVNFHIANIRNKFKVHNRQQAVIKAIQLGLLEF